MILNPKIFRAYDIRGEAFVDFDEDGFYLTAQAFGKYISQKFNKKSPKIFVSGDGRISMKELSKAVLGGLHASGADVIWGGAIPTPINYFAFHEGDFDASIQISASHNPPQDNGLKFCDRKGSVCGDEIQEILKITRHIEENISVDMTKGSHEYKKIDYTPAYREKLKSITPSQVPLKIVADAGNAIPGTFYPLYIKDAGHEVFELFCAMDGNFPNHQPDPERPENLKACLETVLQKKADLGVSFDGDGDRVGIILADGTILNADKILYILASDFLSRNSGEKIIIDAMISATLIEKLKKLGGVPIITPTGHSYIEQAMHTHKAKFGGEQSGHFMFGENFYGHDDACLAVLRFITAIENNPSLIKEVTDNWPKLLEFSEKITVEDEQKFEILNKVSDQLVKIYPKANTIDGIRIDWKDGEWAIIRCSNTSPKISVRIEAVNKESLEIKKSEILGILNKFL